MDVVNSLIMELAEVLLAEMKTVMEINKTTTVSPREVQTAVKLALGGQLAKIGIEQGTKALTSLRESTTKGPKSVRAGLCFPVSFFATMMKQKLKTRVSKLAAVYLAAVSEYIAAEILNSAANDAKTDKAARITPRHLHFAVFGDSELSLIFHGHIRGGGFSLYVGQERFQQERSFSATASASGSSQSPFGESQSPLGESSSPFGASEGPSPRFIAPQSRFGQNQPC